MGHFVVGLTGGIGSGKSAVSDQFQFLGITIADADVAASGANDVAAVVGVVAATVAVGVAGVVVVAADARAAGIVGVGDGVAAAAAVDGPGR